MQSSPKLPGIGVRVLLATLVLVIFFAALYPLGEQGSRLGIRPFEDQQQKVMLLVGPLGLTLLMGTAMGMYLRATPGRRFLLAAAASLVLHSAVFFRCPHLKPIIRGWGDRDIPNPASIGIAMLSAAAATGASYLLQRSMADGRRHRWVMPGVGMVSAALSVSCVLLLAPFFRVEWSPAPAVLNDRYALSWERSFKSSEMYCSGGFWFPSGSIPLFEASAVDEPSAVGALPVDPDGLFVAENQLFRVSLDDGAVVWSRRFDFGQIVRDELPSSLYVCWSGKRFYVFGRGAGWSVFAFDWDTGEPLWEIRRPESAERSRRPVDPRSTAVVSDERIVMIPEEGKAEYEVIDPETGLAKRYVLPAPQGTVLAETSPPGGVFLGPYLLQGPDGDLAALAYFADPGTVVTMDSGGTGYLFGISPTDGEVSWRLDVSEQRFRRVDRSLKVARNFIIQSDEVSDRCLTAWDPTTGVSVWRRTFSPDARFLVTSQHSVVYRDGETLECLDNRTGNRLWTLTDSTLSHMRHLFLYRGVLVCFSPASMRVIDPGTGRELSRLDAPGGRRLGHLDVNVDIFRVRILEQAGSRVVQDLLVNPITGRSAPANALSFWPMEYCAEGYFLGVNAASYPSPAPNLNGFVPVFKAQGRLRSLVSDVALGIRVNPLSGGIGRDGTILLTSYDSQTATYHVYMLRPRPE